MFRLQPEAPWRLPIVRAAVIALLGGLALACTQQAPAPAPQPTTKAAASPSPAAKAASPSPAAKVASPSPAAKVASPSPAAKAASPSPAAKAASPAPAPKAAAPAQKIGGTVSVLATWGGDEQESFLAMVRPFEERTGITVQYEGTRDLNAVLTTRVEGGNPPDVAGLPGPGQMAQFARAGRLTDLSNVLDQSTLRAQYSDEWLRLSQVDGKQVGIFIKSALKGLIWYNPPVFQQAGYQIPRTWDETLALSERIAGTGTTPWCVGLESAAASGWPATDWIENIVLRQSGPGAYEPWHQGTMRWTAPEIKRAWETWGRIVTDPRMVFGGRQGVLATAFGDAGDGLFTSPPNCYLHHQGSFITTFYTQNFPNVRPGTDFNFFMFPEIDPRYTDAIAVGGDLFGMFKDTPQARALIQYLTTPEAQAIWVRRGGAISPNQQVPLDAYPDPVARDAAETLTNASIVRFDASDLMPEEMNAAFWRATLDYVNNPANLDSILANLDQVQAAAYR